MRVLLIIIFVLGACVVLAQKEQCSFYFDTIVKQNVYTSSDSVAVFIGGDMKYIRYLQDNIKIHNVMEMQSGYRFFLIINEKGETVYVGFRKKPVYETSIPEQIKELFLYKKLWHPAKCKEKAVVSKFEGVLVF